MQRNHTVNKANPGLRYNKQKLQLLPNTNELTTHIMGKETSLLINISHKVAKFKALFSVIMSDVINPDVANDFRVLKLQFLSYLLTIIQCLRQQISDQTYRI